MKNTRTLLIFSLLSVSGYGQTAFQQAFNAADGTTVSAFVGASPNLWSNITSNNPSSAGIATEALQLNKASGGQVRFAKTENLFAVTPQVVYVQFDIEAQISEVSVASNPYNYLFLGNFDGSGSQPSSSEVFARLVVFFSETGNSFRLRDIESSTSRGPYSGKQTLTWVLNSSASTLPYNDGKGHSGSVGPGVADIWVGNNLEFDERQTLRSRLGTSTTPQRIKYLHNFGNGTMTFDNFSIVGSNSPLPVALDSFHAQAVDNQKIKLDWTTTTERNSSHFIIERSTDATHFQAIAQVTAAGNSREKLAYSYTDETPQKGVLYYRLRQVDTDFTEHRYRVVSVQFGGEATVQNMKILGNPITNNELHVQSSGSSLMAYDALGRQLSGVWEASELGENAWVFKPINVLPSGNYIVHNGSGAVRFVVP